MMAPITVLAVMQIAQELDQAIAVQIIRFLESLPVQSSVEIS